MLKLISFNLESEEELKAFVEKLAKFPLQGHSIGLIGPLGAGKTTFVRYLVKYLGSKDPVSSPSFTLQHEYALNEGGMIEHWDLYRVKSLPDELLEPPAPTLLRLIEWCDRFPDFSESLDMCIAISFGKLDSQTEGRNLEIFVTRD
ncbi:MAG: tRNA (adenosine(37)-N6)-threonylcarbamoyltransferase complex ATPase subunit type 1 TsaE [SAR324 cluster bacterium]|uniref:tRNA threonylcarbamoyladenosine biosynthesis protein TsaE n=1 Tax=SAR324 cluster bacterium TaxID=2024889 RepID=A0A7X9FSM3_9DELT|nr:tRNA (adenosine(37)-N6)-threonylcarbamoyltransferase complex ATPase subunit type 1 TsaE [SAR324 cluster bacterium]